MNEVNAPMKETTESLLTHLLLCEDTIYSRFRKQVSQDTKSVGTLILDLGPQTSKNKICCMNYPVCGYLLKQLELKQLSQ